jgi:TolB-like protein
MSLTPQPKKFFHCSRNKTVNTKNYLIPLLLASLALNTSASGAPPSALTVAVYDFSGGQDAARYVNKVTALLTADLAAATNFVMVERAGLTAALKEQAFGGSGMVNSDAAAKIGQMTGAKVLVAGQVMKIGEDHLILVANVVGTESGRLFADKVEGAADNLLALTEELSLKIAQTISLQTTNLTTEARESTAARLDRIIKALPGTNRPSVSVRMTWSNNKQSGTSYSTQTELGSILLKAGFPVVDATSDRKPDIEITGSELAAEGPRQGDLYSFTDPVDVKVQERRTGNILAIEHQVGSATDIAWWGCMMASEVNAIQMVAEKILPLLSKQNYEH